MKKNKYEDIEMLELEDKVEDILEIYIDCLYHTDKTVGIVVNKEIAEYILDAIIQLDETSVKEIDLVDCMNTNEYLLSVDNDGYITCVPIEDYVVLDNVDVVYIDMDGDINQDIIDYCVNEDKEVILFGQEDDCCDGDCEKCNNCKISLPINYFSVNGKEVSKDEYENKMLEIDKRFQSHMKTVLEDYEDFIDEMNNWKSLLGW